VHPEYLTKLQDTYFDYFKQNKHLRVLLIDVTDCDFVNNRDHYEQIAGFINQDLEVGTHYFSVT
jgi:deoxyadenosine/deoxycytidine kinase